MKSIEITTTQNVTIEYQIATVMERFLGYLIDLIIIIAGMLIASFIYFYILSFSNPVYYWFLLGFPIFFFYNLLSEIFMNGQTLGKKALRIKVVRLSGKEPTLSDYLVRWSLRMVDIYFTLGSVAALTVSSSDKGQRLGDLLSGTIIIKLKPSASLRLNDILNIQTLQNYQPQFPQVKYYNEDDMLLIKRVIDQVKKYPNSMHQQALDDLIARIKEQLNITSDPADKIIFLRTLISDYIVLTR